MSSRLVFALIMGLCAVACQPAAAPPPAPAPANEDGAEDAIRVAPRDLVAYCRTPSGRVFAAALLTDGTVEFVLGDANGLATEPAEMEEAPTVIRLRRKDGPAVEFQIGTAPPEDAWTKPIVAVAVAEQAEPCEWRPRTRLAAVAQDATVEAFRTEAGELLIERRALGVQGAPRLSLGSGSEEALPDSTTLYAERDGDRYILFAPETYTASFAHWRGADRLSLEALPYRLIGDDPDAQRSPIR